MALRIGSSEKLKIATVSGKYHVVVPTYTHVVAGSRLLSSDGYVLKDANDIYLMAMEVDRYEYRV